MLVLLKDSRVSITSFPTVKKMVPSDHVFLVKYQGYIIEHGMALSYMFRRPFMLYPKNLETALISSLWCLLEFDLLLLHSVITTITTVGHYTYT